MDLVVFFLASVAAIASAVALVVQRNPFISALALLGNLVSLAALMLLLEAQFVAAAQVIVYAGAVMVMFLFVIAYVGPRGEIGPGSRRPWQVWLAVLAALAFARPAAAQAGVVGQPGTSILSGGGWAAGRASPDEKTVALTRYLSANESQIWTLDVASGSVRQVAPAVGSQEAKATYSPAGWSPDGRSMWIASDRAGEFRELMKLELASGRIDRVSAHIPWDVNGVTFTEDGRKLAAQFNIDGRDELRFFDASTAQELPAPAKLPSGNVGAASYHHGRGDLAFSVSNAQGPSQIYSLGSDGQVQQWTRAAAAPGMLAYIVALLMFPIRRPSA